MARRSRPLSLVVLLCVVGAACSGSSPTRPDPTAPHPLGSLDEECEGLTARQVLDGVPTVTTSVLQYHDRAGTTPIRVEMTYEGGTITCIPAHQLGGPDGPYVSAQVAIAMRTRIRTDDGAFDEDLSSLLTGWASGSNWSTPLMNPADLRGTWDPLMPGYEAQKVSFDGHYGRQPYGNLSKSGRLPGRADSYWPWAASWTD